MKTRTPLLFACLVMLFVDCKHNSTPEPDTIQQPYFNQVNIALTNTQFGCLLDQWYSRKFKNEPVLLRVINDTQAYTDFFAISCDKANMPTSLTPIDFSKNTLLIGAKADYGEFINTPSNITQITQQFLPTTGTGNYKLQVDVSGQGSDTARTGGHEWFAFVSLVPKLTGSVTLDMHYHFSR